MRTTEQRSETLEYLARELRSFPISARPTVRFQESGALRVDAGYMRVVEVYVDDTDVVVTEWNSERTQITMSEAIFRGADMHDVAAYIVGVLAESH